MRVAVIGDVHGTTKWKECYKNIKEKDNDVSRIIVLGDWFDPYFPYSFEEMKNIYNEFIEDSKNDDRIISILGNHDLSGYIINDGGTNRTSFTNKSSIAKLIKENLPNSYLVYKIGNYLFSHAGVSKTWYEMTFIPENNARDYELDLFKKGWTPDELIHLCYFNKKDTSLCGDSIYQSPIWIRPGSLMRDMLPGYNQVVGHTQVKEIINLKNYEELEYDLWLVDNQRKPEYLILNIEEGE